MKWRKEPSLAADAVVVSLESPSWCCWKVSVVKLFRLGMPPLLENRISSANTYVGGGEEIIASGCLWL